MKKTGNRLFFIAAAVLIAFITLACRSPDGGGRPFEGVDPALRIADGRSLTSEQFTALNIVARDDYGRTTASADSRKTDKERYVGVFFLFWLGQHSDHSGIYDVSDILERYGRPVFDSNDPRSPAGAAHFWGKPVWGYYNQGDPWVMRKQIEMLTMIGIDYLLLDATNALTYDAVASTFFSILKEYRDAGWNVPKPVYLSRGGNSSEDEATVAKLYDAYYKNPAFSPLFFAPEGKPMICMRTETQVRLERADATPLQKELADFFHIKNVIWPDDRGMNLNGMAWMDYEYPQKLYGESMSVSCTQGIVLSNTVGKTGRGWNWSTMETEADYARGTNYQSQWNTALNWNTALGKTSAIKYLTVTGWNGWAQAKSYTPLLGYHIVDQYNDEFSTDIEPSLTGTMKDKFYLQTAMNIRKFAYEEPKHYIYPETTVDIGDFSGERWEGAVKYLDFQGEAIERDYFRFDKKTNLIDVSNRNDIASVSVARDRENLYFRIETTENIKSFNIGDKKWMNIWIRTKNGPLNDIGFNYVINKNILSGNRSEVSKALPGGSFYKSGEAEYSVNGKILQIKAPLSALGLDQRNYDIEFKVTDNIRKDDDILDFYSTGDSAPIGSLCYKYGY